jgi:hypothetical protein
VIYDDEQSVLNDATSKPDLKVGATRYGGALEPCAQIIYNYRDGFETSLFSFSFFRKFTQTLI